MVTTRKLGRQRFVYLNPVPIVQLARRWLDDYGALAGLTLIQLRKPESRSRWAEPGRDRGCPVHR